MKKKLFATLLAVALVASIGIGSTLAYLSDSDVAVNTFTVGKVDISLVESQYHRTNAGVQNDSNTNWRGTRSQVVYDNLVTPGSEKDNHTNDGDGEKYLNDAFILADADTYHAEGGYFETVSTNMVPGRVIHKNPYVVNNGNTDAYVRVRVYVPKDLYQNDASTLGLGSKGCFSWTTTGWYKNAYSINGVEYKTGVSDAEPFSSQNEKYVVIDGIEYTQMVFVYNQPLAPGAMTFWNCIGGFKIPASADVNDDIALQDYVVGGFKIIVQADAIQAEGFDNANAAFAAFDNQKDTLVKLAKTETVQVEDNTVTE